MPAAQPKSFTLQQFQFLSMCSCSPRKLSWGLPVVVWEYSPKQPIRCSTFLHRASLTQASEAANRPLDEEHPYGHEKFENFSSLVQTALLGVTSIWIFYEAGLRLLTGFAIQINNTLYYAIAIMIFAIIADFSRFEVSVSKRPKIRKFSLRNRRLSLLNGHL